MEKKQAHKHHESMGTDEARKVAIVGARGYSGLDLARILLQHPQVSLEACFATDSEFRLSDYLPETEARAVATLPMSALESSARALDTVFLATPAETSMELAPKIIASGANVIDLSGAFRLRGENLDDRMELYSKWYGIRHPAAEWIDHAHYGLVPWAARVPNRTAPLIATQNEPPAIAQLARPRLIANPGCYATSILMAILPLLKAGFIDPASLVIDAKSGTSGAGRKAAEHLLYTEVDGECLPYRIARHQHFPEIREATRLFSGIDIDPMLTTSLINVRRGIMAGIYAKLKPGVGLEAVGTAYAEAYPHYSLARVAHAREFGSRVVHPLISLKRVAGSARTHIAYEVDDSKLYIYSSIDNLLKGAASQAVENLNRLWDLPPETALTQLEGVL